jgi:hypothetical protein
VPETVAINGSLLIQAPLGEPLESAEPDPAQTSRAPVIGGGTGFTVMPASLKQPAGIIYKIVVYPEATEVTTPVGETEAMEGFRLIQFPPGVAFVKVTVVPAHITEGPTIISGKARTVTTVVTTQPEGNV